MTNIFLHGKLAKKYGKKFRFAVSRPKDVISAIDTIHEEFSKDLIDLANAGQHYSIIADDQVVEGVEGFCGKKTFKEIHIIPTIFGAGVAALAVGAVALIGAIAAGGTATLIGSVLLAVAFSAISFGIQALLTKPPKENAASASASTVSATSKSFLFTNKENVKQQGNPVPIGYGRLRIGSAVVQETIKSYPNSLSTFNEFVSQSTQQGQGTMSIINNQQA